MLPLAVFVMLAQDPGAYLTRIGHKFAATDVRVVKDAEVRAVIAVPENIEISTALFSRLRNEAELAGVLAHLWAHVGLKTECIRYSRGQDEHTHDREHEREADLEAIRAVTRAGYDPFAMLDFFSRLRHEDAELSRGFSAEDLLIERLELEATDHPLKDPVVNTPEFERAHAMR